VGCPLPIFTEAKTVQVYLTFDGGYFFSNGIDLQIIQAPLITCLESMLRPWIPTSSVGDAEPGPQDPQENCSRKEVMYYYNRNEIIKIRIHGKNLGASGHIYIRVSNTTLKYDGIEPDATFVDFEMPMALELDELPSDGEFPDRQYRIEVSTDGMWFDSDLYD